MGWRFTPGRWTRRRGSPAWRARGWTVFSPTPRGRWSRCATMSAAHPDRFVKFSEVQLNF
ncbi:hypothetical protein [Trichloromonas sp.]|uniref:hypothetical protein n=1 Tax=Trichloromonas sp. TaxID=3069249 RepID=UPI003D8132B7